MDHHFSLFTFTFHFSLSTFHVHSQLTCESLKIWLEILLKINPNEKYKNLKCFLQTITRNWILWEGLHKNRVPFGIFVWVGRFPNFSEMLNPQESCSLNFTPYCVIGIYKIYLIYVIFRKSKGSKKHPFTFTLSFHFT